MVWRRIQAERLRGRACPPRFDCRQIFLSWAGGLISSWSHYPLVAAPSGASTVLLCGDPTSPLAQPRSSPLTMGLAMALGHS
jgi:hypothetical protein